MEGPKVWRSVISPYVLEPFSLQRVIIQSALPRWTFSYDISESLSGGNRTELNSILSLALRPLYVYETFFRASCLYFLSYVYDFGNKPGEVYRNAVAIVYNAHNLHCVGGYSLQCNL